MSYRLETVQDFLIKLNIKPLMHLLKISIFSLNNELVRLTKIMNNLVKDLKIQSHFSVSKIGNMHFLLLTLLCNFSCSDFRLLAHTGVLRASQKSNA